MNIGFEDILIIHWYRLSLCLKSFKLSLDIFAMTVNEWMNQPRIIAAAMNMMPHKFISPEKFGRMVMVIMLFEFVIIDRTMKIENLIFFPFYFFPLKNVLSTRT